MPIHGFFDLPEELQDVVVRMFSGEIVYGFELHLFAEHVSQ